MVLRLSSLLFVTMITVFFQTTYVEASTRFEPTRIDNFIPPHCRDIDVQNFEPNYKTVFFGLAGYKSSGFTDEWMMSRTDATVLWDLFKARAMNQRSSQAEEYIARNPSLQDEVAVIEPVYRQMGFDFKKEGDVLEILSLIALAKVFNPNDFYFTGGFSYHHPRQQVMGELDILVARKADCKIIIVGEAKLGKGAISHARQQLARFHQFLMSYKNGSNGGMSSLVPGPLTVRRDQEGRLYDSFGYLMDFDTDLRGRPVWSPYGR